MTHHHTGSRQHWDTCPYSVPDSHHHPQGSQSLCRTATRYECTGTRRHKHIHLHGMLHWGSPANVISGLSLNPLLQKRKPTLYSKNWSKYLKNSEYQLPCNFFMYLQYSDYKLQHDFYMKVTLRYTAKVLVNLYGSKLLQSWNTNGDKEFKSRPISCSKMGIIRTYRVTVIPYSLLYPHECIPLIITEVTDILCTYILETLREISATSSYSSTGLYHTQLGHCKPCSLQVLLLTMLRTCIILFGNSDTPVLYSTSSHMWGMCTNWTT